MRTDTDNLVYKIMDALDKLDPDEDPGDLRIEWQDDSALVTASQGEWIGMGNDAESALKDLARQKGIYASL